MRNIKNRILGMGEFKNAVADLFSSARIMRVTHEQFLDMRERYVMNELRRVTPTARKPVYTQFMHGYVTGLMDCEMAALYRYHLEFGYVDSDGVIYSTHADSTHRKTEEFISTDRGSLLGEMPRCHFWKGTDKPFGVVETNEQWQARRDARNAETQAEGQA